MPADPGDPAPESLPERLRRQIAGGGVGAVLVRGASGAAGAHVAGAVLALLAQLVIARQLGVGQYGYYAVALAWIMLLAIPCRLGLQAGLIRFTAAYRAQAEWAALRGLVRRAFQIVTAAAVLAALALAAGVLLLRARLPSDQVATFLVAAAVLVPLALLGIAQGLLQGYRRPARALLPNRALVHAGTLVLALALAATAGLERAPVAMTLNLVATLGALAIAGHWVRAGMRPEVAGIAPAYRTGEWLRVSLPLLLMAAMHVLMRQVDTVMLGAIAGTDAAGLYYPVARVSELATIGLMATNAIVAPMVSELHTTDERARLQRLLTLAAIGTSATTVVVAIAFWLAGEWALGLFGAAFTAGYPALMILLAGQVVNALCGPVGLMMSMTGHQDRAALVITVTALANVALNAALIPRFGLTGAAAATAMSIAAWNLWLFVEVRRRHGLNPSVFARWPRLL